MMVAIRLVFSLHMWLFGEPGSTVTGEVRLSEGAILCESSK